MRALRKDSGLNQEAFAVPLNVTRGTISDIERGTNNLSLGLFWLIVEKYGVDPVWLYHGVGQMQTKSAPEEVAQPDSIEDRMTTLEAAVSSLEESVKQMLSKN